MILTLLQGNTRVSGEISKEDCKRLYKKFNGREVLTPDEAQEITDCMKDKEIDVLEKAIVINWIKGEA